MDAYERIWTNGKEYERREWNMGEYSGIRTNIMEYRRIYGNMDKCNGIFSKKGNFIKQGYLAYLKADTQVTMLMADSLY